MVLAQTDDTFDTRLCDPSPSTYDSRMRSLTLQHGQASKGAGHIANPLQKVTKD